MTRFRHSALVVAVLCPMIGCSMNGACPDTQLAPAARPIDRAPFQSTGDVFDAGPLAVNTVTLLQCDAGAPRPMVLYVPIGEGPFAVVDFQHGFLARPEWYSEVLWHLASHGFVVVAPLMYELGPGPLLGNPSAAQEAQDALAVLDWIERGLPGVVGVSIRPDLLGLAGHSRGGKVIWSILKDHPQRARVVAGVDPVDGAGGPLGGQPRVLDGPITAAASSLVIGTGLGGRCAPDGSNHVRFFAASPSPSVHIVATDAGHADMLDESLAAVASGVCQGGPDRAGMRRLTAGLLTAHFRAALQNDDFAAEALRDGGSMPIEAVVEDK